MSTVRLFQLARATLIAALVGVAALAPALAQDDPPGRVGRVADLNGGVSWFDSDEGQWTDAERNRPLTGGDRISTAIDGRAELRVGSTVLRLSNSSEIEVLRLDDEKLVFELHTGSVAVRVRSREVADEIELLTSEARLLPQRAGHYRVDRVDDTTLVGAWRGELRVADTPWQVAGGQRIELVRENRGRDLRQAPSRWDDDGFAAWVLAEDSRDSERTASHRYVSPEMTGAEDLDRHGRWDQHPEYGAIWFPAGVRADWAPYRYGRWTWVRPWGWTWVDEAPWGFAPFHYGRWVHWRNSWCWVPGAYVARPVYAPALVAWIGGGAHWSISLRIGGPPVGWVPLAPREAYRPHYRHTPVYVDRVNPGPRQHWHHHPRQANPSPGRPDRRERPWVYGNQAVPGAVTVVPGDVLVRRQPVARAVIDQRELRTGPGGAIGPQRPAAQLAPVAPPPGPPVSVAPRGERVDRRDERRDERREGRRDDDHQRREVPREDRRDDHRDGRRDDRPQTLRPAAPWPAPSPAVATPAAQAPAAASPAVSPAVSPAAPGPAPAAPAPVPAAPAQTAPAPPAAPAAGAFPPARQFPPAVARPVPPGAEAAPAAGPSAQPVGRAQDRERRERDRHDDDAPRGRQRPGADARPGFAPEQPPGRRDNAAPVGQPQRAQPAARPPVQPRLQAPAMAPPQPAPQLPQAPLPPPPRAAAPERAGQAPPPRAAVVLPPAAAPAAFAPPPAAVRTPPREVQRPPRERDDERKGRAEPAHRMQPR